MEDEAARGGKRFTTVARSHRTRYLFQLGFSSFRTVGSREDFDCLACPQFARAARRRSSADCRLLGRYDCCRRVEASVRHRPAEVGTAPAGLKSAPSLRNQGEARAADLASPSERAAGGRRDVPPNLDQAATVLLAPAHSERTRGWQRGIVVNSGRECLHRQSLADALGRARVARCCDAPRACGPRRASSA